MSTKSKDTDPVYITSAMAEARGHDGILRLYHLLSEYEVDEHREDLDTCSNYDKCLTRAAHESWRSFSCKYCEGNP